MIGELMGKRRGMKGKEEGETREEGTVGGRGKERMGRD